MSKVKKLVYSKDLIVPNLFVGASYRDFTISGRVYKEISKSWFSKNPKIKYSYTISIPFIPNPFYDGEYATNRILKAYSIELKQMLIDKIEEFEYEQNS